MKIGSIDPEIIGFEQIVKKEKTSTQAEHAVGPIALSASMPSRLKLAHGADIPRGLQYMMAMMMMSEGCMQC